MKFLRTIHFDESDNHVYDRAAASDEWAVSGAFAFAALDPGEIKGKVKQAFSNGFLGLSSFGRSTFVTVGEIEEEALLEVENTLATHFVEQYAAPDRETARPAVREEMEFVSDLCSDALVNMIFTVRRYFDEDGMIREEFRSIQAPSDQPLHARIWSVVEDNG